MTHSIDMPDHNPATAHFLATPIETSRLARVAEASVIGALALLVNHSPLDMLSGGYAADTVGTAARISCMSVFYRRGDPLWLPVGTAFVVSAAVEKAQEYHWLGETSLHGLDGVYDVRDFAAFALGTVLYLSYDWARSRLFRHRQSSAIMRTIRK